VACLHLLHKVLWRWEHIHIQMSLKHMGVHSLSVHVTGAAHILPVKNIVQVVYMHMRLTVNGILKIF